MSPSNEVNDAVGAEGESLDARRERLLAIVEAKSEKEPEPHDEHDEKPQPWWRKLFPARKAA